MNDWLNIPSEWIIKNNSVTSHWIRPPFVCSSHFFPLLAEMACCLNKKNIHIVHYQFCEPFTKLNDNNSVRHTLTFVRTMVLFVQTCANAYTLTSDAQLHKELGARLRLLFKMNTSSDTHIYDIKTSMTSILLGKHKSDNQRASEHSKLETFVRIAKQFAANRCWEQLNMLQL